MPVTHAEERQTGVELWGQDGELLGEQEVGGEVLKEGGSAEQRAVRMSVSLSDRERDPREAHIGEVLWQAHWTAVSREH